MSTFAESWVGSVGELELVADEAKRVDAAAALYEQLIAAAPEIPASERPPLKSTCWRSNYLEICDPPPLVLGRLPSMARLGSYISLAARDGAVFKAIGAGWGSSDLGVSHDLVAPMARSFDRVVEVDGEVCRFLAGTRIATLSTYLSTQGLALENAPGFDELTFAGVMCVGGQGSGLGLGPLSSQVRELEMLCVDADGGVGPRVLTPDDGDTFRAAATSLGGLGVVTAVTVGVVPAYFLRETRRLRTWAETLDELPELLARQRLARDDPRALHSAEIWLAPYATVGGRHHAVIGTRAWDPGPRRGQRPPAVVQGTSATFEVLCTAMRRHPALIPALIHGALAATQAEDVVLPWAEALDFGSSNRARVRSAACSIPVAAIEDTMRNLLGGLHNQAEALGRWITAPLGLRFAAASDVHLAPGHGRESCLIEMPILACTPFADETLAWFLREAVSEGRPHWGQCNALTMQEILARYPRAAVTAFRSAMRELDPRGVFLNARLRELADAPLRAPKLPAKPVRRVHATGPSCSHAHDARDGRISGYSRLFYDGDRPAETLRTEAELLRALERAKAEGRACTVRGGGFAMDRQAIRGRARDTFLYLDDGEDSQFSRLAIDEEKRTLTVGAAVRWHRIIHEAADLGLLPKVIVTAANATVGGTLASNSISQGSRMFGHEADGLVSVRVAVPEGDSPAIVLDLRRPAADDDSESARLFRAVIGGFGLLGVILEATYELVRLADLDERLPPRPVAECDGIWATSAVGYAAVTHIEPYPIERLAEALGELRREDASDNRYRACLLLWDGASWCPRVTSTHIERRQRRAPNPLISYAGNTRERRQVEVALSTMATAAAAGAIAARATAQSPPEPYVDPLCGYAFAMLPNELYKAALPPHVAHYVAPSVQMTYVLPEGQAASFILGAAAALRAGRHGLEPLRLDEKGAPWLLHLAEAEYVTQLLEAEADKTVPPEPGDVGLPNWIARMADLATLVPTLFEVVWLPKDDHLLSSTNRASGYAVSLIFQGPGVSGEGPFRPLHNAIFNALGTLTRLAEQRGGGVHLTKNVFVCEPPGTYVARMLGDRLERLDALRQRFDPRGVLTSRFAEEVLGRR